MPTEWIDLRGECLKAMRDQIQKEIDASYTYLAMGAHFSRDTINRPGFAEHFFKAAKEERQHGAKLIEYLSMRGQLTDDVTDLIMVPVSLLQIITKYFLSIFYIIFAFRLFLNTNGVVVLKLLKMHYAWKRM